MAARHLRTVIGTVVIGAALVAFLAQHVWPWHEAFTWQELASTGALMLVGLLLVDRNSGLEVLTAVKDKLPVLGKPKS